MYSPNIPERLIPTLQHRSRLRRQHMTALVAEAIPEYVARQDLAPIAEEIAASERYYAVSAGPRPTSSSGAVRP